MHFFERWTLENHNKSHKNAKKANSVALYYELIDLHNVDDVEVCMYGFAPVIVHAC